LREGDEVLATDLEYGACDATWEHVCRVAGARYVRAPVEELLEHRTERTRAVFVSHITSETALRLPVERIVADARAAGLTTIVDGAHAIAQVDLDLAALGADFYAGNCHKWLCAPKGAGFLYVAPHWQERVHGTIVSWGYLDPEPTFISRTERQGTRDSAAYLAVPAAIEFVQQHDERDRCVALSREARRELSALLDTEPPGTEEQILQMASVQLPVTEPDLNRRLFEEHRIELPTMGPRRDDLLRISIALYTTEEDVERLLDALPQVLSSARSPA
jgi:isopenicillin-N epimerase